MAPIAASTPDSLEAVIAQHATATPNRIAISASNESLSYGELYSRSITARDWYRAEGLTSGDRVLVGTDNRNVHFPVAYFGAHLAGLIVAPIDYRTSVAVVEERKTLVNPRLTLMGPKTKEFEAAVVAGATATPAADAGIPLGDLASISEIIFTSGTTGTAKGVALTHANVAASAELIRRFIRNDSSDAEVVTVPLSHSFGLGRLRSTLLAGGHVVLVPGLAFPQEIFRLFDKHNCTGISCVPSGMRMLLEKFRDQMTERANRLRYIEMGSAAFSDREKEELMALLPKTRLCMHYGLTEASRSVFMEFHTDRNHLQTVGRASPGVELEIRDRVGTQVDTGAVGLIHVRARTVMHSYWANPTATAEVLDSTTAWLNTGDLGSIDEHGYVHLHGRASDVINCGGEKIRPEAIEALAKEYPGVLDVGTCAIPDPNGMLGQVPLVCVVPQGDELDLRQLGLHLRRELAPTLADLKIVAVNDVPRTESGKLMRSELRRRHHPMPSY